MPMLFALATSVGVLAVVATWLFSIDPLASNHLQIWQAFIAWGCHFHSGGKSTGTRNTIACMSFGSAIGMGAILLAGQLASLGQLAAPVAVGLGAAVIVLASRLPILGWAPGSTPGRYCVSRAYTAHSRTLSHPIPAMAATSCSGATRSARFRRARASA